MIDGEIKELVSVIVDLRRKRVHGDIGYDLLTIIQSGDLKVEIGSDITSKPTEENWSFEVSIFHLFVIGACSSVNKLKSVYMK